MIDVLVFKCLSWSFADGEGVTEFEEEVTCDDEEMKWKRKGTTIENYGLWASALAPELVS